MKTIISILLTLAVLLNISNAAELVRGATLTDGQTLSASDLHGLIDTASIGAEFYSAKTAIGTLPGGYYFLVYDSGSGLYRRISATSAIYGNTNSFLNPTIATSAQPYSRLLLYNPTNNTITSIALSNAIWFSSTNVAVSNLVFATTNGLNLPQWSGSFGGAQTNNQPFIPVLSTNASGLRYVALSNFEANVAADLGTNLSLPYTWRQMWQPWTVYPNNSSTNAWGYTTNFPITSLWAGTQTNTATLQDTDAIPILASGQFSNTTVTLSGVYQYLTNKTGWQQKFTTTPVAGTSITSAASIVNVAHGLSGTPQTVNPIFTCTTVDLGYAVGDTVSGFNVTTPFFARPFAVGVNATNVYATASGTMATSWQIVRKDTGAVANMTPGSWNFRVTVIYTP